MPHDLNKSEKKLAREIIHKGLQTECRQEIEQLEAIIKTWRTTRGDHHETYLDLYKNLKDFNKHIAFRYDGLRPSYYTMVIAAQLAEGMITANDLEGLREETIKEIMQMSKRE